MIYNISGDDESLFQIDSATGFLTFILPPNYENELDSNQDNLYEITVTIQDRSGDVIDLNAEDYASFNLQIDVQDEAELPTLSEDLSDGPYQQTIQVEEDELWTWDSLTMFDLIATDEDDGETDTLSWTIINQDLSAGEAFITGTGQTPTSFTYVPELDYDGTNGNGSFTIRIGEDPSAREVDFVVEFIPVSDLLTSVSPSSLETISKTNYGIHLSSMRTTQVQLD